MGVLKITFASIRKTSLKYNRKKKRLQSGKVVTSKHVIEIGRGEASFQIKNYALPLIILCECPFDLNSPSS